MLIKIYFYFDERNNFYRIYQKDKRKCDNLMRTQKLFSIEY